MKNKKALRIIAIILSIIILIIDIFLYTKMKFTWSEIESIYNQYEKASSIIEALFIYGALMWGILLIPMVWLEYLLINLFIKIYNKFNNLKRLFFCLITLVMMATILILFIRIMLLIIITLV